MNALMMIQQELKAPKNQTNTFGGYKYRSCEDILEAVKPLLAKHGIILTLTDFVGEIGGIPYIEAHAILKQEDGTVIGTTSAQAGIDLERKGMGTEQRFGSASSYARKYALNGLFLIDDTKDADATNTHGKEGEIPPKLITEEQAANLRALADEINLTEDKLCVWLRVDKVENTPAANYSAAVKKLVEKRGK